MRPKPWIPRPSLSRRMTYRLSCLFHQLCEIHKTEPCFSCLCSHSERSKLSSGNKRGLYSVSSLCPISVQNAGCNAWSEQFTGALKKLRELPVVGSTKSDEWMNQSKDMHVWVMHVWVMYGGLNCSPCCLIFDIFLDTVTLPWCTSYSLLFVVPPAGILVLLVLCIIPF